ncbi:hypothetical protein ACI7RC_05725 [Brevibacillus sp. B_LB10_24]|uniref:hypothetical protein n=1 Tax=Brevibacillus sp. B_LB10_24 TaxID=3380645 RepID=UPI0038B958BA
MDKYTIGFILAGCLMSIIFLVVANFLTSPDFIWFLYPGFTLLLLVMSWIFIKQRKHKLHSVLCSLLIIMFLFVINCLYSPGHPWFLYAIFPLVWWPASVLSGKKAKTLPFACIASLCTIVYYSILNIYISPPYPWAIYPAYAVLWWPLALYYAQKRNYFGLSISASILTILFFITVNLVSSPGTIWAIYPIFLILWWPLSMYYYHFKKAQLHASTKGKY